MIEITSDTIERVETLLAGVPKGAERAFTNAINRGLSHTKTQAFKQVKAVYAVKQSALNEATKTRVQKASSGNLAGYVSFSGVKIPLYKFSVSPKEPGKKRKVRAGVMKGGGIALSLSIASAVNTAFLFIFLNKSKDIAVGTVVKSTLFYAAKMCVFSAIASIPLIFFGANISSLFSTGNRLIDDGGYLAITAAIFAAIGVLLLVLTKDPLLKMILKKVKR